jgi:hypothetical protein
LLNPKKGANQIREKRICRRSKLRSWYHSIIIASRDTAPWQNTAPRKRLEVWVRLLAMNLPQSYRNGDDNLCRASRCRLPPSAPHKSKWLHRLKKNSNQSCPFFTSPLHQARHADCPKRPQSLHCPSNPVWDSLQSRKPGIIFRPIMIMRAL